MIKSVNNDLHYSVMITSIRDEKGKNITTESNMSSIDSIVKKYLNSVTFYWNGRIITLLMATRGSLDKYLHIAAEEICQSVNRILGKKCRIGMGRVENGLSSVRKAYLSAMKAVNYAKEKGVEMCFISDVECHKNNVTLIVEQALEIIEKNYMNPDLSLVSIGAEIGVSPNYLSASIKKIAGNTFIDLLSKKRIDVAKEHLLHSNMKIREVAERCGYSDQHYFSYCFKKYTGMSPNTCRRQNAEGK